MGDGDSSPGTESYILSSDYRVRVLEGLAEQGRATPTELAEHADEPRSHVSRALSELEDRDVVSLAVPEGRRVGRYYELTTTGRSAWEEIEPEVRGMTVDIGATPSPTMERVVSCAEAELGDSVCLVGVRRDTAVSVCYTDERIEENYAVEELEEGFRTLRFEHALDSVEMLGDECWSDVIHFGGFSVLRVLAAEDRSVLLWFDNDGTVSVPDFAANIESIVEESALAAGGGH